MVRRTQHERSVALLCFFRKAYVFRIVFFSSIF